MSASIAPPSGATPKRKLVNDRRSSRGGSSGSASGSGDGFGRQGGSGGGGGGLGEVQTATGSRLVSSARSSRSSVALDTVLQTIKVPFKARHIQKLSVSPEGQFGVVGGKRSLWLVDLSQPWELQNRFRMKGHHDFSCLSWGKGSRGLACAISDSVVIWEAAQDGKFLPYSRTRCHHRNITDISWSKTDKGFISTCSLDGVVKIWDTRTAKSSLLLKKLSSNASAPPPKLARWNRANPVIVASAHGNLVRIWDLRKPATHIQQIVAATGEVLSLDWSFANPTQFVTCSGDFRFRIWCTTSTSKPIGSGVSPLPLEQAVYSPFGDGIVVSGKSSDLLQLYDTRDKESPTVIGRYGGSGLPVTDICWRRVVIDGSPECQLVTWSNKEETLRMFAIDPSHIQQTGHKLSKAQKKRMAELAVAPVPTTSQVIYVAMSLAEEISLLPTIPGVTVDHINIPNREVEVGVNRGGSEVLRMKVTFPSTYPQNAPPAFTVCSNETGVDDVHVKEETVNLSMKYSLEGRNCLEACLRLVARKVIHDHVLVGLLSPILSPTMGQSRPTEAANDSSGNTYSFSSFSKHTSPSGSGTTTPLSSSPNVSSMKSRLPSVTAQRLSSVGEGHELHIVSPGETVQAVALTFSMSKANFRKLNDLHPTAQLVPGRPVIVKRKEQNKALHFSSAPKVSKGEGGGRISTLTLLKNQRDGSRKEELVLGRQRGISYSSTSPSRLSPVSPRANSRPSSPSGWVAASPQPHTRLVNSSCELLVKEGASVGGNLTLTPTQLIFEPNLNDPHVKKQGLLRYTVVVEMAAIIDCEIGPAKDLSFTVGDTFKDVISIRTRKKIRATKKAQLSLKLTGNATSSSVTNIIDANKPTHSTKRPLLSKTMRTTSIESPMIDTTPLKRSTNSISNTPQSPMQELDLALSFENVDLKEVGKVGSPSLPSSGTYEDEQEDTPRDEEEESDSEDILGQLNQTSFIFDEAAFKKLRGALPPLLQDKNWDRLFTTYLDGTSMTTLYSRLKGETSTIIIVKDSRGHVFGGFASEEWTPNVGFKGTGQCFVFSLSPSFARYGWTGANELFMLAKQEYIAMGGGTNGRYAFYLDGGMGWGTSGTSNTFLNRQLSSEEHFQCVSVEVWCFS
eukprot:TRINITY_DN2344_c0_g1_i1.p1 TRINITY_DN2344_c0_g1~~TRINITY_DN2344_c0_g1_i1.p1  ORF type:complete len:1140 (+),score=204.21 TRINITY_DN2344_c0_g1_i1:31-3420(+)